MSSVREQVQAWATDHDVRLILLDPPEHFDAALVGIVYGHDQEPSLLYDEELVLAAMTANGMSREDAEEFFAVNTVGAYIGPSTPRFLIYRITQPHKGDGT